MNQLFGLQHRGDWLLRHSPGARPHDYPFLRYLQAANAALIDKLEN